jgi:hypothetical protein
MGHPIPAAGLIVTQPWLEAEFQDRWTLSAEELALLPGMTDKGRLGFALQLKFIQIHGRFPEQHEEIDPNETLCIARQLGALNATLSSY